MKTITTWQPWASLIACGAKQYETRGWGYTPHWSTCNAPDSFRKGARK